MVEVVRFLRSNAGNIVCARRGRDPPLCRLDHNQDHNWRDTQRQNEGPGG